MAKAHRYNLTLEWTGNRGEGTASYRSYDRDSVLRGENLPDIAGSSDPSFRGNPSRWNPEQLLVAAAAQCHMLAYLHLAAVNGVTVVGYVDHPVGVMTEESTTGRFTELVLHPLVTITDSAQVELAESLHAGANEACFIAASLNFTVSHQPRTLVSDR